MPRRLSAKPGPGILPIFKNQPGFVAYGVMVRGNQLISMSAWKSAGDAKAADELAGSGSRRTST
jgi:hypothetical protein